MTETSRVMVSGRELRCQHCGHRRFAHDSATLDRRGYWALFRDDSALIYICARCGYAHFFMPVPDTAEATDAPDDDEHIMRLPDDDEPPPAVQRLPDDACLACGAVIAGDAQCCPACGWTWESTNAAPEIVAETVPENATGAAQPDERIRVAAEDRRRSPDAP